jgi:hypothetical protein
LTSDTSQPFVDYVQTQVNQGITGPALVPVVTQRIQTYVPEHRIVMSPSVAEVEQPVVARARGNPHGGPPGLIKKELGLQTGAEVVHGARPVPLPMISSSPVTVRHTAIEHEHEHGEGHGRGHEKHVQMVAPPPAPVVMQPAPPAAAPVMAPPPGNPGKGHGEGDDHGQGKGHGKGH